MTSNKEHLNVGTIGHVDHGKTTLTAAIMAVQAARVGGTAKTYDEIAKASESQGRRDASKIMTIATAHVEYESETRHYAHVDCPGHADFIKNMVVGAAQMDVGVVLVDASKGPQVQTLEHILLARQVGVEHLVVFINKVDISDEETIELVEMEAVEALEKQGYTDVPIIKGSATEALAAIQAGVPAPIDVASRGVNPVLPIMELVEALDAMPVPRRDVDGPFMMPIENVHSIPGRGTVVTGRVDRGRVKIGDKVEVVGLTAEGDLREVVVIGTQMFHKDIPSADAGMNVGLLLRGVKHDEISRGQVLAVPGSVTPRVKGQAEFYVLSKDEGGRSTPFGIGYRPQFFFGTADVMGAVVELPGRELVMPGDRATIGFELGKPVGLEVGMRFAVREGSKTVGAGRVTSVV